MFIFWTKTFGCELLLAAWWGPLFGPSKWTRIGTPYIARVHWFYTIGMDRTHKLTANKSEWTVHPLNLWGSDENDRMIGWFSNSPRRQGPSKSFHPHFKVGPQKNEMEKEMEADIVKTFPPKVSNFFPNPIYSFFFPPPPLVLVSPQTQTGTLALYISRSISMKS